MNRWLTCLVGVLALVAVLGSPRGARACPM